MAAVGLYWIGVVCAHTKRATEGKNSIHACNTLPAPTSIPPFSRRRSCDTLAATWAVSAVTKHFKIVPSFLTV
ncbi:hypothetical protein F5884DRAFT_783716 [Xylogone sp. PMI_703]|nr:hypothetical protein F5884DRAFT_783716 [Xylogone sp. PMI_703]